MLGHSAGRTCSTTCSSASSGRTRPGCTRRSRCARSAGSSWRVASSRRHGRATPASPVPAGVARAGPAALVPAGVAPAGPASPVPAGIARATPASPVPAGVAPAGPASLVPAAVARAGPAARQVLPNVHPRSHKSVPDVSPHRDRPAQPPTTRSRRHPALITHDPGQFGAKRMRRTESRMPRRQGAPLSSRHTVPPAHIPQEPRSELPLEPTYGSPGAHPAGTAVGGPRAESAVGLRGRVPRSGCRGRVPRSGCRGRVPRSASPGCRRNAAGKHRREPWSSRSARPAAARATAPRPLSADDVPYPCFSRCPPKPKRIAESTWSAKSASPRELKRS